MPYWRRRAHRADHLDRDTLAIKQRLEEGLGASVEIIGQPLDLLVGYAGVTMLVEVKAPPGPRGGTRSQRGQYLSEGQERFIAGWRGARPLVVTLLDAVEQVRDEARRLARGGIGDGAGDEQVNQMA